VLILSLQTDDLLIPLSQSFMHLSLGAEDLAKELVLSIGVKWLRFGQPALDRYERMLTENANDEPAFQGFFCEFPKFLDLMAIQVWSQPDFHCALEADFVVRWADDSYLVVEIECPGKPLLTKAGQFSQAATHAEKQVLDYESFLSERIAEARTHFPNYQRADCLAVVGLERSLREQQRQDLDPADARRQNLNVVGFDWLLQRARCGQQR
jgi:Shedu protein SduA, C-terminal